MYKNNDKRMELEKLLLENGFTPNVDLKKCTLQELRGLKKEIMLQTHPDKYGAKYSKFCSMVNGIIDTIVRSERDETSNQRKNQKFYNKVDQVLLKYKSYGDYSILKGKIDKIKSDFISKRTRNNDFSTYNIDDELSKSVDILFAMHFYQKIQEALEGKIGEGYMTKLTDKMLKVLKQNNYLDFDLVISTINKILERYSKLRNELNELRSRIDGLNVFYKQLDGYNNLLTKLNDLENNFSGMNIAEIESQLKDIKTLFTKVKSLITIGENELFRISAIHSVLMSNYCKFMNAFSPIAFAKLDLDSINYLISEFQKLESLVIRGLLSIDEFSKISNQIDFGDLQKSKNIINQFNKKRGYSDSPTRIPENYFPEKYFPGLYK